LSNGFKGKLKTESGGIEEVTRGAGETIRRKRVQNEKEKPRRG